MNASRSDRPGVTLIEIMVCLLLVSTVLLVSLTASANLLRNDAARDAAVDAQRLAGEFLDEVSAVEFRDAEGDLFGLEPDERGDDRRSFDDVDDYHGYLERPPTRRDGTAMPDFANWSIEISVTTALPTLDGIVTTDDPASPLRIIEVVCTTPGGDSSSHYTLVSNVPSNRPEDVSYQRWRELSLEFPDRKIRIPVPLRNRPTAP